jgi:2'-5' RNA ligase
MEELLCRYIQNVCNLQHSFTVALNNFSGFPPPSISIRIQNTKPFFQLGHGLQKLNSLLQSNGCPPVQTVHQPHILLARQPDKESYEKAIAEYAPRSFHEVFTVNRLVLLKKDSAYKKWQTVTNFYLPAQKNVFN